MAKANGRMPILPRTGRPEVHIDVPAVVGDFLNDLSEVDLIAELIQNELDAGATSTRICFERDALVCEGDGKPVNRSGWERLTYVLGAGGEVPAKEGGSARRIMDYRIFDRRHHYSPVRRAKDRPHCNGAPRRRREVFSGRVAQSDGQYCASAWHSSDGFVLQITFRKGLLRSRSIWWNKAGYVFKFFRFRGVSIKAR